MRIAQCLRPLLFPLPNLLYVALAAYNPYSDPDVVVLTFEDNFTEVVEREKQMLVEFYAPWCSYCQRLMPEYGAAATTLKGRVPIAKIDATQDVEAAKAFGVKGYPTILWFVGGKLQDRYPTTPSTEREIVEWVDERARPLVEEVEAAPTWFALGRPNVVLNAPELTPEFKKMAEQFKKEAYFFHLPAVGVLVEKVTIMNKGGKSSQYMVGVDGDWTGASQFVAASWSHSDVVILTNKNFTDTIKQNKYVLVAFLSPTCGHCKALEPEYHKAATALRGGEYMLAKVDATAAGTQKIVRERGPFKGYPTLIWYVSGREAQHFNGRRSMGGIVEWVQEQVLPVIKKATDPLPEPLSKPRFGFYGPRLEKYFERFADRNRNKASFYYVKKDKHMLTLKHVGPQPMALLETEDPEKDIEGFLRWNMLPEFSPFTTDFFDLMKAAGVGCIRLFYVDEDDFNSRLDPLIRQAKPVIGVPAQKYGWTSVKIDGGRARLNCHKYPCLVANKEATGHGGTRYPFGDYDEEEWTVENLKLFFDEIEAGTAEGVRQGKERTKGPLYTTQRVQEKAGKEKFHVGRDEEL